MIGNRDHDALSHVLGIYKYIYIGITFPKAAFGSNGEAIFPQTEAAGLRQYQRDAFADNFL